MSTLYPSSFLRTAEQHGLTLIPDGDNIRVRGPEEWRKKPAVVDYIRRHKKLLLQCLDADSLPTEEELNRLGFEVDAEIKARQYTRMTTKTL